jgi:uncharacterized protein (DUF697 family)
MFTLQLRDFFLGLAMAVFAPVATAAFAVLGAIINAPGFDAWTVDYGTLFHNLTNTLIIVSYSAGTGYIIKNFLTDNSGRFLGLGGAIK